jgi:Glycosyl transferase family 11
MISIFLQGGLGNQLFQIATAISYCIKNKVQFVFPYSEVLPTGMVRPTYWDSLLSNLKRFTTIENPIFHNDFLFGLPRYNEQCFHYVPIPEGLENNILFGYFQSYKYFEEYKNQILKITGIEKNRKQILEEFKDIITPGEPSISIHFRLGDYKEKQQYHPVLTEEYYDKAIQIIPKEYLQYANVYYFCEEEDRHHVDQIMTKLYDKHGLKPPICIDHSIPDWKQMLIMSYSQINIIANSSYSWWAAYINDDPKKTVIYPSVWFGPALRNHNTQDLFPESWISVAREAGKPTVSPAPPSLLPPASGNQ